jgi:hypothetical protein
VRPGRKPSICCGKQAVHASAHQARSRHRFAPPPSSSW